MNRLVAHNLILDALNGQESDNARSPWIESEEFESLRGLSPIVPWTINWTAPAQPHPHMLTAQSPFSKTSLSPAPTPTLSIPQFVPIGPLDLTTAPFAQRSRRTLTDEKRRQMCLYHEKNKSARQIDIGVLFGVERSTVSKVLRQKEKYLSIDDGSRSAIKRSKEKVPDIEKALANWARNYQRQGFVLTDAMIKEKVHFFATACASPDERQKILTASWLEKFKEKNNLPGSKSRKNSADTIVSDGEGLPHFQSPTDTLVSMGVSPISHNIIGLTSSPLSPSMSQETLKKEFSDGPLVDFSTDPVKHAHSQTTTPLDTTPSLSASVASPTSPLVSEISYPPNVPSRLSLISSVANQPLSQMTPLAGDAESLNGSSEQYSIANSKHPMNGSLSFSVVDLPLDDDNSSTKHHGSNSDLKVVGTSMRPPPVPRSGTVGSTVSLGSPTQDEARHALALVMNYIQNQPSQLGLQMQDYVTMGKLMEKLDLVHNNQSIYVRLPCIGEDTYSPQIVKKRRVRSLIETG